MEEQLHRVSLRAVLPLKFPKLQLREIHSLEQLLARQLRSTALKRFVAYRAGPFIAQPFISVGEDA